ncbi:two-component system cell cycle response regulator/two-component system alkaline phosphatase synthesis response regulator PhoP/putative two-component system response regulator [Methanohalophilus levihalophilus]|uniref:response regulator transcription factor n=1 Tax=Methanohalophilus levihalophilus TaxID=1431282 RepID=UPI001AE579B3|nr:response regulator [Methanohalophilus levihalophilus]MBP2031100.1 two-component system cell cycle response regulator/two-component system alkaline phosphatase synthesis response regulator PhoP/putative two-component system response regulator [Methanohalophilus levihalophilus]
MNEDNIILRVAWSLATLRIFSKTPDAGIMISEDKPLILVVDDEPDVVELLEIFLEDDYSTIGALNATEGLKKAKENNPDLIILDVMMPDLNGLEACKLLKNDNLTRTIPIMIFSALTDTSDKRNGMNAGANAYLTKPINPKELLNTVADLILKKSKHSTCMLNGKVIC